MSKVSENIPAMEGTGMGARIFRRTYELDHFGPFELYSLGRF